MQSDPDTSCVAFESLIELAVGLPACAYSPCDIRRAAFPIGLKEGVAHSATFVPYGDCHRTALFVLVVSALSYLTG